MTAPKFCSQCGCSLKTDDVFCPQCGANSGVAKITQPAAQQSVAMTEKSTKSGLVAFLLCLFFGAFGMHRFYVGKIGTGILMLITGGGLGLWVIIDLCFIICNAFTDKFGHTVEFLSQPTSGKKVLIIIGAIAIEFILLVITIVTIAFYATSGLTLVVNEQLSALRSGDIEKAYLYNSKDFRNATPFDKFKQFIDQYPSLKTNESASFYKREIENNLGTLTGTLKSKDGAMTPIEYRLIKEDGTWKILYILVNPTGAGVKIDQKNSNSDSTKSQPYDTTNLTNTYSNNNNKYSIKYPSDWEYVLPDKATVVISGKKGTASYYSTVNIQTILTSKKGGKYNSVDELMNSLKKQAQSELSDVKFLAEDVIDVTATPIRQAMHGRYLVLTYTYKGESFKQMQFVFERNDGLVFYTWGYTSPSDRYDSDYPIAKAMFSTWSVY